MPKGYALSEATKDGIWELRAEGLSDREIGRRLGLSRGSVSNHLARTGGIRPRARRRPERGLSVAEREEISRAIARGHSACAIARALRRSHTTVAREINRCGGRWRYRAHAADREAWRRSRRPRPTKLELCPELRRLVSERLREDHSPEQISGWLRVRYPDNEAMRVSDETIYRALYVQARGTLRRELEGSGAVEVADALKASITTLPAQLRRSLTSDQGSEMAEHRRFSVEAGLPVYFCDPRSPWQRGLNENTNGLLRQ